MYGSMPGAAPVSEEYQFLDAPAQYGSHMHHRQPPNGFINPQQLYVAPTAPPPVSGIQPAFGNFRSFASYPAPPPKNTHPEYYGHHDLTQTGPQQSRKPATPANPDSDDARANIRTFDPKVLLNPKGAKSAANRPAIAEDNGASTDADAEGPGMSRFINDIHRITERDAVPQRTRKSEIRPDDEEEGSPNKKPKSTFSGAQSGGQISEYLAEERKKQAAESGPSTQHIDLTGDDDESSKKDDEVQFIESKQSLHEEICLGVLNAKANMSRIPDYSSKALGGLGKDHWPRVRLDYYREPYQQHWKIELKDRKGRIVGTIEARVASALCPLLSGQQVNKLRMTVYLEATPRHNGEQAGVYISKTLPISLILYSPRAKKQQIGQWLSQKQMWLGGLNGFQTGKEVDNPHQPVKPLGPRRTLGDPRHQKQLVHVTRTQEEMRVAANNMFDGLVKHDELPEMEVTSGILITPLLKHQKQALRFLTEHESASMEDSGRTSNHSLWRHKVDGQGRPLWEHVVTGQQVAQKPELALGGILADMMGLGKTLSILALTAESRTAAEDFGEQDPPDDLNVRRNAKGTLIICPTSVMTNWHEQIQTHVRENELTYYSYHGPNRTQDADVLANYDIVLTTYGTAAADFRPRNRALAGINWFRIVLDEAHSIRNQTTVASKACIDLSANRRWAVTGTPVQNGLSDLGALIKFLRIAPFDRSTDWTHYIVAPLKQGSTDAITHLRLLVDSITLRRMKDTIDLKGRKEFISYIDFPEADSKIYKSLSSRARKDFGLMNVGAGGRLKGKAYAHVLKSLLRMRMFCVHGLDMFSEEDRKEIVEGLNPDNAIAIDLGDEPEREQYNFVPDKQAYETLHLLAETDADRCERCAGKIGDKQEEEDAASDATSDEDEDDVSTSTTPANDTIGYLNTCFHLICPKCKDAYVQEAQQTMTADQRHECPCCATYIRYGLFEFRRTALREFLDNKATSMKKRKSKKWDESNYAGPSAKVQALLQDLRTSAEESAQLPDGEPPIRSVVFSSWTTYMDLIEMAFDEHGIGFVRLDGSMSIKARAAVLEQFKTNPTITVLLVSIKAGGQGLNFTAASNVYVMEPQYNPGVEHQAIDRVHRLGQKRDVRITRYIMNDSVEGSVVKLQERKEDLANFTLEKKLSKQEEAQRRIESLRDLFTK